METRRSDMEAMYEYYKLKCNRLREELGVLKKDYKDLKSEHDKCPTKPTPSTEKNFRAASTSPERPLVEISENVRGKKRKNLPGFTCQKCDAYYKAANLGADGIQKCTRHRGSLYDRPVTPPGWWDPGWSKEHDAE